ncbi:MAG: energy transducer TonB [Myxococcales bacterium]|nr:energy transducer TonB [Myxococcales bacterium]
MNIGVLEDRWVSGARSVRWRDGDATRLIGALLLAIIFHLAFATSVTEFLKDEPETNKALTPPEEPVLVTPSETAADEAREELDEDEVVFVDEPPARGLAPAGEAFPHAATSPPPAPTPELPPELAATPSALPEFEPIVQADPAAIAVAILPPEVKRKVAKKDTALGRVDFLGSSDSVAVLAALDDSTALNAIGALHGEGTITNLLSSNGGAGIASGLGAIGGTIGGSGDVGLIGTGRGPDIDLVHLESKYTRRIRDAVARVKSYPAEAEADGLEGTVTLELTIDRAGTITAVEVGRTSGHTVLDEAALRSVRKLGRLPAPPAELEWQEERKVRIPVTFRYD